MTARDPQRFFVSYALRSAFLFGIWPRHGRGASQVTLEAMPWTERDGLNGAPAINAKRVC